MREVDHREGRSALIPPQKDSVKKLQEKIVSLTDQGEAKFRVDGYNATAIVKVEKQSSSSPELIVFRLRDDAPIEDRLKREHHYPFKEMLVLRESDQTVVRTNFGKQTVPHSLLGQGNFIADFDKIVSPRHDEVEQMVSFASEQEVQEMLLVAGKISKKDKIDLYGKTLTEREKESGDALRINEQARRLLRKGKNTGKHSHITTVVFKTDIFDVIRISGERGEHAYNNSVIKIELDPVPHLAEEDAIYVYYVGNDKVRGFRHDRSIIDDRGEHVGFSDLKPGAKNKNTSILQQPGVLTDHARVGVQERKELLDILLSLVNSH